jgi:hypothetical protein
MPATRGKQGGLLAWLFALIDETLWPPASDVWLRDIGV